MREGFLSFQTVSDVVGGVFQNEGERLTASGALLFVGSDPALVLVGHKLIIVGR